MRRVYQRQSALAVGALLLALLAACGRSAAEPARREPVPSAGLAPPALELFLAASAYELATVDAAGAALLVTEIAPRSARALLVPRGRPDRPRYLTPPESECRAVSVLPEEASLVECADPASGEITLRVRGAAGGEQRLAASSGSGRESLLARSDGGATLWTATATQTGTPARLLATGLRPFARRPIFTAPAGFAIVAVEPASSRAALRRELTPEADEIVLHDWRRGESRLLLPSAADGRFTELVFVDGGRALLLLADDGSDVARLERLDLASGRRSAWGAPRCPPRWLRAHADGSVTVGIECAGRREAQRFDALGAPLPPPPLPAGVRLVDLRPDGAEGALAVVTAGERWPAEIGRAGDNGDFHPRTYGLAARLPPGAVPAPRPFALASAGQELPAELWPAVPPAAAVVIWFESAAAPPRFGEHRPLAAALAAHGISTLIVRGRGSDGVSRRLRRAADGDPAGAALADLRAAAGATAALAPATAPRLLVGEGAWWGAVAVAVAAEAESPFAASFALYPDPDPFAEALAATGLPEPLRGFRLAQWGDPESDSSRALRDAWSFPVERARRPLWTALDPGRPTTPAASARLAAAAAAGAAVEATLVAPRRLAARLPGALESELARRLSLAARPPAR